MNSDLGHRPHRFFREIGVPTSRASDAELISRFAADRDEAAFELLLHRHGPMVLGVCRRLLSDPNDVDDAFQAVFVILAKKAGAITRAEMVVGWLHRVARRVALRTRVDRSKRAGVERPWVERLLAPVGANAEWAELNRVLDEEVSRLPARNRAVFVLCCLEGKTCGEAGGLLGCPPGTVSSRLTRARKRLRERLTERGLAPAVVAIALTREVLASPASGLVLSTLNSALTDSPGMPRGRSAEIARGVMRAMFTTKLKSVALLLATGLLAVGGLLAGTGTGSVSDEPPPPSNPNVDGKRPTVRVVHPQVGGLERTAWESCTAEPARQVDLYPSRAGVLKKVNVEIGDRVKTGQILAEVDTLDLALDERQAVVGIEQVQAQSREAEARVLTARAEVEAAKGVLKQRSTEALTAAANLTYRKKQYDRLKQLLDRQAIEQRIVDEAELQLRTAENQSDAAAASIETAKAELEVKNCKRVQSDAAVGTARANVEAAKLALEKARVALAQANVTAPFDGVVTRRNGFPGDRVRLDVSASDRSQLFTVVRVDAMRVVVSVPERNVADTQPGVEVELQFDALRGVKIVSKIARIGFGLDPANRTMRAEIDIPNPEGKLRPGMYGTTLLKFGKGPANAVRVPASAVASRPGRADGNTHQVYVYRNGKASLTPVRVAWSDGKEVEVVAGLTEKDLVVIDPTGLSGEEVPIDVGPAIPPKK